MSEFNACQAATVLIVDDHPIFRRGVQHLLEGQPAIGPVVEAASIPAALAWLRENRADIVLLDQDLPGITGVEGIPLLFAVQEDLQVIMLTVSDEDEVFFRAVRGGACGYILKDAPPRRLLDAITAAAHGESRVSERMLRSLHQRAGNPVSGEKRDLLDVAVALAAEELGRYRISPREQQVLARLIQGHSNKEIARDLAISPNTVRNQLQRLQERFEARNRVQLAMMAYMQGLV